MKRKNLNHSINELVDQFATISSITTLIEMNGNFSVSTSWGAQFEWPEEV